MAGSLYEDIERVTHTDARGIPVHLILRRRVRMGPSIPEDVEPWPLLSWRTYYEAGGKNRRFYSTKDDLWRINTATALTLLDQARAQGMLDSRWDDPFQRFGGGKTELVDSGALSSDARHALWSEIVVDEADAVAWGDDPVFVVGKEPGSGWRKAMIVSTDGAAVTFRSLKHKDIVEYKQRKGMLHDDWMLDMAMPDMPVQYVRHFADLLERGRRGEAAGGDSVALEMESQWRGEIRDLAGPDWDELASAVVGGALSFETTDHPTWRVVAYRRGGRSERCVGLMVDAGDRFVFELSGNRSEFVRLHFQDDGAFGMRLFRPEGPGFERPPGNLDPTDFTQVSADVCVGSPASTLLSDARAAFNHRCRWIADLASDPQRPEPPATPTRSDRSVSYRLDGEQALKGELRELLPTSTSAQSTLGATLGQLLLGDGGPKAFRPMAYRRGGKQKRALALMIEDDGGKHQFRTTKNRSVFSVITFGTDEFDVHVYRPDVDTVGHAYLRPHKGRSDWRDIVPDKRRTMSVSDLATELRLAMERKAADLGLVG